MEREFLRRLLPRLPAHPQMFLGPGDDAALLRMDPHSALVVTTDMLMDGVDFILAECDPVRIGRKSLAVNLSDLAAMAAKPVAAFISLALPRQGGAALADLIYDGILPLAKEFDVAIAGGDTNSWNGPLVISIAVIGEVQPGKEWRRSGGKLGDKILVTGSLGGSILGRHFDFPPRVSEARYLADRHEIHAAMDVSDGLSLDLSRLAEASGLGAVLDLETIPIAQSAQVLAAQEHAGSTALEHALGDGEDFELLLIVAPDVAAAIAKDSSLTVAVTCIGELVAEPGLWQRRSNGDLLPLVPRGFQHEFSA